MGRQVIDIRKDGEKVYVKNHAKVTFLSDGTNVEQRIIDVSNDLSTKVNKDYIDDILENIIIDSSQIDFNQLQNNPFIDNNSGKLEVMDESGNIIAKIDADGIHSVDFITGEHRLSNKADKTEIPTKLSDLANDTNYITIADIPPVEIPSLDEYVTEAELQGKGYLTQHQDISHLATRAEVADIDFYDIKNNPVINSGDGKLLFVDESGNIGLQLENNGLYVSNVFAGSHVLSNKADKSEVPTSTSQLTNDSGYITKPVVDQAIASLVDSAPETLDTIGEIASALKNNANIVDVLNQSISAKQNTIEDLEAIRAGASLGATALQEIPEEYVTRDEIPNLPSLDEYAKKEDIPSLDGYATQAWVNNNNYATEEDLSSIEFNSLQNNPLVEDSNGEFNLVDDLGNVGFKVNQEGLFVKDVIAGNHVLSNKANVSDIPAAVTESTVSGWGFTKNAGTYSKPSGGIPKTDLASAVQTSLGKADTALQSYTEQYKGTVTGVKINGTNKNPSNGIVDLGTVITTHQTLKTINGESIVGSGDITISGGNSDANVMAVDTGDVLDDVNVDYATTSYVNELIGDINSVLESIINS